METTNLQRQVKVGDTIVLNSFLWRKEIEVKVEEIHRDPSGFFYFKYRNDDGRPAWESGKRLVRIA